MQKTPITWNPGLELEIFKWCLDFKSFGKILGYSSGAKLWKLLRFDFCCTPLWESYNCTRYKLYHICNRETRVGYTKFQNIGLSIWTQQGSEHVKPCCSNWVKIKGAQLKINLHHPQIHWMLIKNGKRTMMIHWSLQSYWNVKFMKNVYISLCQHFFWKLSCNNSVRKHQITMVLWQYLITDRMHYRSV